MQEAVRLKKEMLARQKDEMTEAEEAFAFEKEQQEASWAEKIRKYEEDLVEAVSESACGLQVLLVYSCLWRQPACYPPTVTFYLTSQLSPLCPGF